MTAHSGQRHPWWLLSCRWCTVRHITVASPVCTPFNKLMLSTNKADHTHLEASLWSQLHAWKVSVTHLAQLWYYHIDSAHRQTRRINKYSKPLLWYFLPQRMSPDWSQPEFPVIKRQTNSCKEFDFIWCWPYLLARLRNPWNLYRWYVQRFRLPLGILACICLVLKYKKLMYISLNVLGSVVFRHDSLFCCFLWMRWHVFSRNRQNADSCCDTWTNYRHRCNQSNNAEDCCTCTSWHAGQHLLSILDADVHYVPLQVLKGVYLKSNTQSCSQASLNTFHKTYL